MSHFTVEAPPLVIPDDLTVAQFTLDRHHPSRPLRPASAPWFIEDGTGRPVFFEEVRSRVWGLANSLAIDYHIGNDDVVCIFSPNHVDFPIAVWAAHRLGAAASCANPSHTASELVHVLQASKSKTIVTVPAAFKVAEAAAKEAGMAPNRIILLSTADAPVQGFPTVNGLVEKGLQQKAAFAEPRLAPGEAKTKIAFLNFSSGTTGKPKAVAISHYGPIANVIQMSAHMGVQFKNNDRAMTPGDVALGVLPFFHIYGLVVSIHYMIFSAMSLLVIPKFGLASMLQSMKRFNVTTLFVVPPHVVLFCKHPLCKDYDFSRVKLIISGAAPMTAAINQRLVELMPNATVGQGYGMTETATSISMVPYGVKTAPFGSAGKLMPGVMARIVKPDGSLAKTGEQGELIVKSPSNALGYLNAPEATKETFEDGWVHTGDEASVDSDNWVFIHDRIKELIKVRGFQVAPAELEGHLLSHPDVRDVCVVGLPDEYSGEVPLAFIALSDQAAARVKADQAEEGKIKASVAKYVADTKVAYKHLVGGVHFVDEIPKNPSGKLLRRVLRDKAKTMKAPAGARAKL